MAACPKCKSKIRFHTILFALCPIWITCPTCTSKLAGNIVLEVQAFAVLVISFVGGAGLVSAWERFHLSLTTATLLLVGSVLALVLPNVYLTLKYGEFRERQTRL